MTTITEPFTAVTEQEMKDILGNKCSPDRLRAGYVIGPNSDGELCHVASCFYFNEAVRKAKICNENFSKTKITNITEHPKFKRKESK